MTTATQPIAGYLWPMDDEPDYDRAEFAHELALLEADDEDPAFQYAFDYYFNLEDLELITLYRHRCGYGY